MQGQAVIKELVELVFWKLSDLYFPFNPPFIASVL